MQDENNILNVLNEDCFMEIFSYVPVAQLVVSERVSRRWNYLVHESYKRIRTFKTCKWTSIPISAGMLHSLLKKFGYYLRVLHLNSFLNSRLDHEVIVTICENCTQLVDLDISWKSTFEITDESLSLIWSLKNLQYLNVSGINACNSFMELGKNGKGSKLKELIIRENDILSRVAVCHILVSCPNIKLLNLCNSVDASVIIKIIGVLHSDVSQSACVPGKITLVFSEEMDSDEEDSEITCQCINVTYDYKYKLYNSEYGNSDDFVCNFNEDFLSYNFDSDATSSDGAIFSD